MTSPITCRACKGSLRPILDLGEQPPSNALSSTKSYPLIAAVCESCFLMQLTYDVPPAVLFTDEYPYFSGLNPGWHEHCQEFADSLTERFKPRYVVEIGGNDGTLLSKFRCKTLNVEPSLSVAMVSRDKGIETEEAFWGSGFTLKTAADLIVATNVMAHTPKLREFIFDLWLNLAPQGVFVVEFPWALDTVHGAQFDTIYHEHYSYLSLGALEPIFEHSGMEVFDAEATPVHGGSLRLFVGYKHKHALTPRVNDIREAELPLRQWCTYEAFARWAHTLRDNFRLFQQEVGELPAYGAAAKGVVFLNYCGMTPKEIPYVADTTLAKIGKTMPGSNVPIVPEAWLFERQPRQLLILPWNWKADIIARLRPKLPNTGFVTAIPEITMSQPVRTNEHIPL